mmetsp:Transcript_77881/g.152881  ORF Transcript_77881/g.152881 Transcript_77881/m.152881 type:complete len:315 (-) Transcript_77881:142-1086(-)
MVLVSQQPLPNVHEDAARQCQTVWRASALRIESLEVAGKADGLPRLGADTLRRCLPDRERSVAENLVGGACEDASLHPFLLLYQLDLVRIWQHDSEAEQRRLAQLYVELQRGRPIVNHSRWLGGLGGLVDVLSHVILGRRQRIPIADRAGHSILGIIPRACGCSRFVSGANGPVTRVAVFAGAHAAVGSEVVDRRLFSRSLLGFILRLVLAARLAATLLACRVWTRSARTVGAHLAALASSPVRVDAVVCLDPGTIQSLSRLECLELFGGLVPKGDGCCATRCKGQAHHGLDGNFREAYARAGLLTGCVTASPM